MRKFISIFLLLGTSLISISCSKNRFTVKDDDGRKRVVTFTDPVQHGDTVEFSYHTVYSHWERFDKLKTQNGFFCRVIPEAGGLYRIEEQLTNSEFYRNGKPDGHADIIPDNWTIIHTNDDTRVATKIWNDIKRRKR